MQGAHGGEGGGILHEDVFGTAAAPAAAHAGGHEQQEEVRQTGPAPVAGCTIHLARLRLRMWEVYRSGLLVRRAVAPEGALGAVLVTHPKSRRNT